MQSEVATVTSKGQMVIPAKLRRKYGIRTGTRVVIREEGERLTIEPLTPDFVRKLKGSLKGGPSALDFLMAERRRDREP